MITLDDKLYALMETDADTAHRCTFIEWRRMMLALCREEDGLSAQEALTRFGDLLTRAGVDRQSVVIGQSDLREARAQMGASLCEAVYAARAAKLCGKAELAAHELGLYAYLFPMSENPFVCDGAWRVLSAIREYDAQNHTNLEQTGAGLREGKHGDCRRRESAVSASEHGALPPEQDSAHHRHGG